MKYLFQLGREPELSAAEIQAVFSLSRISAAMKRHGSNLVAETASPIDAQALVARLGGTIKIAEEIPAKETPIDAIVSWLTAAQPDHKIEFSLSGGTRDLAKEIKKEIKALGRGVRYIEPKNTATILHNKLVEHQGDLTMVNRDVFVTKAIQPIEELGERDYGRPGHDSRSGMLPLKLAKIMINLAEMPAGATILDPFCGSGTVLTEALAMEYTNLIGSDISPKAISDTKKNIEWTKQSNVKCQTRLPDGQVSDVKCQTRLPDGQVSDVKTFLSDVKNLSAKIHAQSVDAIVTEPYLGRPLHGNESRQALDRQADELKKLYIEAFRSFQKILKPSGTVIFITPAFRSNFVIPTKPRRAGRVEESGDQWISINILPDIQKMGFSPIQSTQYLLSPPPERPESSARTNPPERCRAGVHSDGSGRAGISYHNPIRYARESQHVARDIWRFKRA